MTARANVGDVVGDGEEIPGNVVAVVDRVSRTWIRDSASTMFRLADADVRSHRLPSVVGPVTVTKVSDEPKAGEWVTVRPDDPRIVDGSRVRLGGVEGAAIVSSALLACQIDGLSPSAWFVRNTSGPDVELWVPAEVTLPLPDGPGVFWGRVERGHETHVGWVLYAPNGMRFGVLPGHDYCTSVRVGGDLWHGSGHVTRLPLPDSEREALR